jgi:UDP-GlcNAc:undecaprenyl-phosphate/decaprenyl-phosphate GlcNAc-1-phosphate transferase
MYAIILGFITAFVLTYFAIPSIIGIAKAKHLYDKPNDRSSHAEIVPRLGGIGIFAGALFSILLWTPFNVFGDLQYILCAFIIIFLIGAKDDIVSISPTKKLVAQILAAFILVYKSNIKITSFYGLFGIEKLPESASFFISMFTIVVIINAVNLLDGINGLAGSIGTLICTIFGSWFFIIHRPDLAVVSFSLTGALVAFLNYNLSTKARIFMGDTGSMLIGLVCAILAINFMELNHGLKASAYKFDAVPAIAISILILPLFDTLRVFTHRILRGKSPFYPDKTHIHHLLLDFGMSHMQATGTLVFTNLAFICLVVMMQHIGTFNLLIFQFLLAATLSSILFRLVAQKNQANILKK